MIIMLYESEYYGITGLGDDHIEHHGVKGMKWGVRKARERSTRARDPRDHGRRFQPLRFLP